MNAHVTPPETLSPDPAAYLDALRARIRTTIGTSDWVVIDQTRIDRFAEATGDFQFVHVDPVRAAAETPFGGTVAHGYLTLAMVGTFAAAALPPHPAVRLMVNLGADKVRLLAPVRVDHAIRGVFALAGVSVLPEGRAALRITVAIECRPPGPSANEPVIVLTADLSIMLILNQA